MSDTALIRSHRKPRQRASRTALRAGVAGGVLSTIAVAGAAGPANAEPVTETIEMPTLTSGIAGGALQSADATQQIALTLQLQAQEDAAATKAAEAAKTAHAQAERKAEAKAKKEKAAKAAREKAAAERASRSTARATLTTTAASSSSATHATTASQSTSTASGSAGAVVAFAKAQLGDAYVMGSTGPNAWDCSGLVQAAYRAVGVDLPRVASDQSTAGTQVSLSNLQPGDILYWGSAGSAYHTAIYVGGGEFVGAQNPSSGVVEKPLSWDPPTGAIRVL